VSEKNGAKKEMMKDLKKERLGDPKDRRNGLFHEKVRK